MKDEEMRNVERELFLDDLELLGDLHARAAAGCEDSTVLLSRYFHSRWGGTVFEAEEDLPAGLEAIPEDSWFTLRPGATAVASFRNGISVYCRVDVATRDEDYEILVRPHDPCEYGCCCRCNECYVDNAFIWGCVMEAMAEIEEDENLTILRAPRKFGLDIMDESDFYPEDGEDEINLRVFQDFGFDVIDEQDFYSSAPVLASIPAPRTS